MFIAPNLKYLRNKFSLKQSDIASYLALSPNTYSNYETGRMEPSATNLIKIAKYFSITVDQLLNMDMRTNDTIRLVNGHVLIDSNIATDNSTISINDKGIITESAVYQIKIDALQQRIIDLENQLISKDLIIQLLQKKD
jgi:transcriptional regulator with XRE-family HTH domain